jgi:MFS family permease
MSETPILSKRPGAAASPSYKWFVVGMLWFVCFFNYADRQAIFAVFPILGAEFGFDEVALGWIGSAFMWVYAAGAPFAGLICDRFRRKDLILGGCLFWSFITMTTGWCQKLWHFVAVRALEGFGETFYFPASMSLTSDYHSPRTRSRALAFHQSSVYIGTILGSWLGALFAERYGWRVGFYFFGAAGMVLALSLARLLREPARGEAEFSEHSLGPAMPVPGKLSVGETFRIIFRSPTVPLLMLAFLAANFVATIFLTWTPTFLVKKFDFKLASAGLSGTVFIHLASACSVPLAGWLADRFSPRFAGGRMLVQALGLLVGATFVFLVGHTANVRTLLLSMTVFGFAKGFYDSGIFASLFDVIEPRARGTAAGIMNTVGWGGGALGPLFVGYVTKHGNKPTKIENMSDALAFGGVIYLLGASLLTLAILSYRKSVRAQAA